MDDLLTIHDDNIGGLQILEFAPLYFFNSLNPVTFLDGYSWIKVEIIPETGRLDENTKDSDHGGYQDVSVTARLPKLRPEIESVLIKYRLQFCAVRMKDQNGFTRLAGTQGQGLQLVDSSSTGEKVSDDNGYSIQFTGSTLERALFL